MQIEDINRIMEIWLEASIKSHGFINKKYWLAKVPAVQAQIQSQANTIVWEEKGKIVGFISLIDN